MEYIFGKNTIESFLDSKNIIEVFIANNFSDEKFVGGKPPTVALSLPFFPGCKNFAECKGYVSYS